LTDTNVGTPGDGNSLLWDEPTNKWVAGTPAGGGNVSNTGTPVNDQLAIWVNATTIEGNVGLTFVPNTLTVGVIDTTQGVLALAGNVGSSGGVMYIYNGTTGDTDDEYYSVQAISGEFRLGGESTGTFLDYTSATQVVGTYGAITSDQTTPQIHTTGNSALITKEYADQYYASSGATYALSGLTDTNVGTPTDGELLVWDVPTARWIESGDELTYTTGSLKIGEADVNNGSLSLYGNSGSTGGQILFYNGATGDTDDEYYFAAASAGTLKLQGISTGQFITYYSSNQQLAFSGAVISDQTTPQIHTTGNEALITKEYADQYYASSGATYALSGLTDTNVGTPGDGNSLLWDEPTHRWVAGTPAGGGNVSNTGTPLNNQVAVWTNATTIDGSVNFTFDDTTNTLQVGEDDVDLGVIRVYGGNSTIGGEIQMYNGATGDGDDNYYHIHGNSGIFALGGNSTGDFLTYYSSNQQLAFSGAVISDQTTPQIHTTGNASLITKEYADQYYASSGATYALSGLTDVTFAITPTDGQSLTWNDSASSWSATTSGGGSATIIDDDAPTLEVGGTWYQPTTGLMHVGVDDSWVEVIGKKGDDGIGITASASTGTTLSLSDIGGVYYNMSLANTATTYTTTGTVLGAFACVLINAGSEPTVTGATKIKGSTFIISTDMHMWVQYFGVAVQFYFTEL
jgi:hypothetical protein